jgi:uncharacterized NAD(P)/FAD-binding protein YdhS
LTIPDRRRFLREDLRYWEVRRHRMAPATAAALAGCLAARTVVLHTGSLSTAEPRADAVDVVLTCGVVLSVGAVVACTGPNLDPRSSGDRLVQSLLSAGMARPGPVGLGLDVSADGRLRAADGRSHAGIWTIGSLRRGNLWETTAIPEIRDQAADIAAGVLSDLRPPARRASPLSA